MSNIRSKDTFPERELFREAKKLWKDGYRYRKNYRKVPGKPDLAFPKLKLAVFVDGEFWHGKDFKKWKSRLPSMFWKKKIKENMERDKKVDRVLRESGWMSLRIWSEAVERNPERILQMLSEKLGELRGRYNSVP